MYHYRLVISYKGSQYFGWQDLGEAESKLTVQGLINTVLSKICKQKNFQLSAASRTDAGVHALGQVAKLSMALQIDPNKLQLGMNSLLPEDIRIRRCETCQPDFNPNKDSKRKIYRYYFSVDEVSSPILNDVVAQVRVAHTGFDQRRAAKVKVIGEQQTLKTLDFELIKQACQLFVGKQDFYNFATRDASITSTVRQVFVFELAKAQWSDLGNEVYYFEIQGNGFLRQMIRYMVAALFEIGRGNLSLTDIEKALGSHAQEKLCAKAKPHGLHLIEISY